MDLLMLAVEQTELNGNQIIEIVKEVGKRGDIIVIKNDGLRIINTYTVLIFSSIDKFESIRCDGDILSDAVKNALISYLAVSN